MELHCSWINSLKNIWFFTIFACATFIFLIKNSDLLRIAQRQLKSWSASLLALIKYQKPGKFAESGDYSESFRSWGGTDRERMKGEITERMVCKGTAGWSWPNLRFLWLVSFRFGTWVPLFQLQPVELSCVCTAWAICKAFYFYFFLVEGRGMGEWVVGRVGCRVGERK